YKFENIAYASIVYSSMTKGRIVSIDSSEAEKTSGVLTVITHKNAPEMDQPETFNPSGGSGGVAASDLPVLRDEQIYWNGQPIAVVVAETQDQADQAAKLVKVEYEVKESQVSFDALKETAKEPDSVLGE